MRIFIQVILTAYAIGATYKLFFEPLEKIVGNENLSMLLVPLMLSIIGVVLIVNEIVSLFEVTENQ